ncbi:hypothetical protein LTR66_009235 [Elasticomyces elasticus]|nr:hypothetical protein LTR66_009235 [Elasticomyces elasticus]
MRPTSSTYRSLDRSLPSRIVSDGIFDDAYVTFILYCNPVFPTSIDTSDLRRLFRTLPKSDGRDFSVWILFELVKQYDTKSIRTWSDLALQLGVEPPDIEKGQSTQKVQQYSVRLKRWMRATHVDAFFEYLLGKQHGYFLEVPPLHDPHPVKGRDGVPVEEDLAIRALDPSFRPKRGRRRNESPDDEPGPPKRPLLTTSFTFEGQTLYAQPQSAHPQNGIPLSAWHEKSADPWAAAPAFTPSHIASTDGRNRTPSSAVATSTPRNLRWRFDNTMLSPHPLSAITPSTTQLLDSAFDEPRSAITPSIKSRSRRKHGPVVSSAWINNSGSNASGKQRGRPPNNRSTQDGLFSTFPADPNAERSNSTDRDISTVPWVTAKSPTLLKYPESAAQLNQSPTESPRTMPLQGRPGRLSLQVPQHVGGPVQLVTPTVLVNGEKSAVNRTSISVSSSSQSTPFTTPGQNNGGESIFPRPPPRPGAIEETLAGAMRFRAQNSPQSHSEDLRYLREPTQAPRTYARKPLSLAYEPLKQSLVLCLLRANFESESDPGVDKLTFAEADSLSKSILARLKVAEEDSESILDDVMRLTAANWLGLSSTLCPLPGLDASDGPKKVKLRTSASDWTREVYDVSWRIWWHGLRADVEIKEIEIAHTRDQSLIRARNDGSGTLAQNDGRIDVVSFDDRKTDWKAKCIALQEELRAKEAEIRRVKDRVLQAVL